MSRPKGLRCPGRDHVRPTGHVGPRQRRGRGPDCVVDGGQGPLDTWAPVVPVRGPVCGRRGVDPERSVGVRFLGRIV